MHPLEMPLSVVLSKFVQDKIQGEFKVWVTRKEGNQDCALISVVGFLTQETTLEDFLHFSGRGEKYLRLD